VSHQYRLLGYSVGASDVSRPTSSGLTQALPRQQLESRDFRPNLLRVYPKIKCWLRHWAHLGSLLLELRKACSSIVETLSLHHSKASQSFYIFYIHVALRVEVSAYSVKTPMDSLKFPIERSASINVIMLTVHDCPP
jgi:hypothetical protein